MNRINKVFEQNKDEKVMSLFITAGYPDINETVDLILGFERNGADIIELGMPFSDPLADGPTIQYSSNIAISNGVSIQGIFGMVAETRKNSEIPIVLMGYINPILRYGLKKFFSNAAKAGVDGLIVPDLPLDEATMIEEFAHSHGIQLIYLIAPNTSNERMKLSDDKSNGFVYCVSVTGVTGAREGSEVQQSVDTFIQRSKVNITKNPLMVGFGIKNYNDAQSISKEVDGFIVGSALIEIIRDTYPTENWKEVVFNFVHQLKFGYRNQ